MKKNKIISVMTAGVLALVALLAPAGVAWADEDSMSTSVMSLSPMTHDVILSPGETYRGVLKVTNPASSGQNLDYLAFVGSFSQNRGADGADDYAQMDIDAVSEYNQIMEWITLSSESGTIAPNETEEIVYTIRVPNDAPAGGQYASIVVRDNTPKNSDAGNAVIESNVQMISIIYAEVTGVTRNEGKITENSVPAIVLNNMLEATSMVQNNGNIHTVASYVLQVWPMGSDEEICTNEESPAGEFIMPETEKYKIQTCKLPSVGIYRVKQTVKIFGEESIVEQTVVYCPIWLMLIVLFVLMLIVIAIVMKVKKGRK